MHILMLFPGPLYDIESVMQKRLLEASKWSSGVLISTSDEDRDITIGRYRVLLIGSQSFGVKLKSKQLKFSLQKAVELNKEKAFTHVTAYDPIRSGLTGYLAKLAIGNKAKLVIEVNGVYQSRAIYADQEMSRKDKLSRLLKLKVCGFVLSRSSAIKLLFPKQLDELYSPRSDQHVAIFANHLDLDDFTPAPGGKQVLTIGYPLHIKGVDLLIAAFDRLATRFPDWKLKIIGFYNQREMEILQPMISGKDYIEYSKPVVRSEIVKHIQACSIFALPSRTEAMGRVLLESMACGKPRVATNVDGIPMVVEDKVDGLLVDVNSVDQLEQALLALMDDPELRERLGQAAAKRAKVDFNSDKYSQNLESFYNSF